MLFQISDEARRQATECASALLCLAGSKSPMCGEKSPICHVDRAIEGFGLFVRTTKHACPYKISFGYSYICRCPVRYEIYERYGI